MPLGNLFLIICPPSLGLMDSLSAVVRLEAEQTKSGEGRTVPMPDVLIEMLRRIEPKEGLVFPITEYYLRKSWDLACEAVGLGGGRHGGLIVHDLRRSTARNLRKAGIAETLIMKICGWKTESVFRRYNIVSEDLVESMRKLEGAHSAKSLAPCSESLVRAHRA